MKTINSLLIVVCLAISSGCYKDKGNYDYKDVNAMEVDFFPKANSYDPEYYAFEYIYRQPATDTLMITYSPEIDQTLNEGDENVSYEWFVSRVGSNIVDTVRAKYLTLKYSPKVSTSYEVTFRATDNITDLSVYRRLRMRTELPFVKSWFVLHGALGERKLGTVEYPDNGDDAAILDDAYGTVHDMLNPFKDVKSMFYTAADGGNFSSQEHLTLLESNKSYYLHAFDLLISPRGYNLMVPDPAARINLSYGVTNNSLGRYAAIVTEDKQFIHGGPNGFYFNPVTTGSYVVDVAYITKGGELVIWDNTNKKFMYYKMSDNWYTWYNGSERPTGVNNVAELTLFPEDLFAVEELNNRTVLWMGTNIQANLESGATAIVKDNRSNSYSAYLIGFGGGGGKSRDKGGEGSSIQINKQILPSLDVDQKSLFATSIAFEQQFFYTKGETLYHYNLVTNTNTVIYSVAAGQEITQIRFRESESHPLVVKENRILALAVLSANGLNGELHELEFSESGDLAKETVFKGDFGPIKDISFSFIHRVIR